MRIRTRTRVGIATIIAVIAWAAMTGGEILVKCRIPDSEACLWARSFFPGLTVPLYGILIGVPAFWLAFWLTGWWSSRRD